MAAVRHKHSTDGNGIMYNYDTGTEGDTLFSALRAGGHSSFTLTERREAFVTNFAAGDELNEMGRGNIGGL